MSSLETRLLGFDKRRGAEDFKSNEWPPQRRELFLLNQSIDCPLSVDSAVWPTMFCYEGASSIPSPAPYTRAVNPGYQIDGIWSDLEFMRRTFVQNRVEDNSLGVDVAIEVFVTPAHSFDEFESLLRESRVVPDAIPLGSTFLGYDVADSSLYSGLCNCGYSVSDKKLLSMQWSSKLNEFGLFRDLNDALQFRVITDARVLEHAPFWIFGLYRIV